MGQKNIEAVFRKTFEEDRIALIPFLTAGDPSLAQTKQLVLTLAANGADIVELGVPFSDPLADGPVIQRASERSLKKGTTLGKILICVQEIRQKNSIPIVLMSYYNPILKMGIAVFSQKCADAGVDGVIIPDFPPEESDEWIRTARKVQLATIFLVAPTSSLDRIKKINGVSRGFLYYVSLTGTTGARNQLSKDITKKLHLIRKVSTNPICVGFGISRPEHVKALSKYADGVIVGSALVGLIEQYAKRSILLPKLKRFMRALKKETYQ